VADSIVTNVPGAQDITLGGSRATSAAGNTSGHPAGNAVDYMVGSDVALGDAIAAQAIADWQAGAPIEYIIWNGAILNSPDGTWEATNITGDPTTDHRDHVHIQTLPA
jgi:hypothetical protein